MLVLHFVCSRKSYSSHDVQLENLCINPKVKSNSPVWPIYSAGLQYLFKLILETRKRQIKACLHNNFALKGMNNREESGEAILGACPRKLCFIL